MDGQKSVEMELDWDAIELQVELYDMGDRSPLSLRAKMLEAAYRDGYERCDQDHHQLALQMDLLINHTLGNA
jgi:hypothetical protein